jgi:signal transduction histidine kinase
VRWTGLERRASDCPLPIPACAQAFLGVPLALDEDGSLLFFYLARSAGDAAFTESDEEAIVGLHALAALAVGQARLLELEQLRAQAISIFIHELRSPLAVISGIADLLQRPARDITDELRAELTEILDRESSRLLRLVSNVLDAESLNHGQGAMEIERCDLVELAAEAAVDAGGKERVAVVAPGAPLSAPVDRDRIKQVLVNLVSNALKFSPEAAPITLSVRGKEGWVEVTVEDYGAGITANDVSKLFNMFSRVGDQDKPGSGLGLYASKAIVEQHGGSMWVESEPGRGSCFGFRLPGPG